MITFTEFTHLDDPILCERYKAIKSNLRKNRFHRTLMEVCSDFIQAESSNLKKVRFFIIFVI